MNVNTPLGPENKDIQRLTSQLSGVERHFVVELIYSHDYFSLFGELSCRLEIICAQISSF